MKTLTDRLGGYVQDCYVVPRQDQSDGVFMVVDGHIVPHLGGYAIVPKEQYLAMTDELSRLRDKDDGES